jgi:hypothetical protein
MMMFEQRTPPDPAHLEPAAAWVPDHLVDVVPSVRVGVPSLATPSIPDYYVVVDELDELGCRLSVDRWPEVDEDGRLVFDDEQTRLVSVAPQVLHDRVTAARERANELAADRPLRIGDVFALWWGGFARDELHLPPPDAPGDAAGPTGPPPDIQVLDVTSDARELTNAAGQAAAGEALTESDLDALELSGPETGRS